MPNIYQKHAYITDMRKALGLVSQGVALFESLCKKQVILQSLSDEDFTDLNTGITAQELNEAITALISVLTEMSGVDSQKIFKVI